MKTNRTITLVLVLLALSFAWTGCDIDDVCVRGKGSDVTQTLTLPPITGFNLKISGDVYVTHGATQSISVTGQENLIDILDLDVDSDGVWDIRFKDCVRKMDKFDVHITLPELEYVRVGGSGDVIGQNLFDINDLEIIVSGSGSVDLDMIGRYVTTKISGSGDIRMDIEADDFEGKISGSGKMNLSGDVPVSYLQISGSGDYKAFDLITDETDVKISGSGDAEVYANNKLKVDIGGSGDVFYKGNPTIDVNVTGSGRIRDAN